MKLDGRKVRLVVEIGGCAIVNVDQGVDGLHKFTLLWGLGADANETTLVYIPVSGNEALHSGIYDGDIPPPAVVVLELGQPDAILVRDASVV